MPSVAGNFDLCVLRHGAGGELAAAVGFDASGRRAVDEPETAVAVFAHLDKVATRVRDDGRYPDRHQLATLGYVTLSTPDEAPPIARVGVFVDAAADRMVVTKRDARGRRVYAGLHDGVFSTNAPEWFGPPFGH